MNAGPSEVAALLQQRDSFLILCHVMPDGDTIGSALALQHAVTHMGKTACVVCQDPVPEMYRFLPGSSLLMSPEGVPCTCQTAVFIDCTDETRAGNEALEAAKGASHTVNIDHHVTNSLFGDLNYVDPSAAAVGEQVFRILEEMGVSLDDRVAICLYVAIATDTGQFSYENTTPTSHRLAARLLETGVKPSFVTDELYESRSHSSMRLLALALGTLRVSPCGSVAWMKLTRSMLQEAAAREDEAEGLINYTRSLRGVEVGILLKEMNGGGVKVGFRSRKSVDVSRLARSLGGGGHPRAAGCLLDATMDQAEAIVIKASLEAVRDHTGLP